MNLDKITIVIFTINQIPFALAYIDTFWIKFVYSKYYAN